MSRVKDMTGITINNLKVIKRVENYKDGKVQWLVECRCGNEFEAIGKYLRNGSIKSCGCLKSKRMTEHGKAKATHGDSKSRLFSIWSGMKKRCYYKKNIGYKNYGGRGIQVCDEWKNNYSTFKLWAMNNGYDESLTLDRVDNDGNYEPNNCKWSTVTEQNRNKRNNKLFNYNGKVLTQSEICEITGLSKHQVSKEFSNESARGHKGFGSSGTR